MEQVHGGDEVGGADSPPNFPPRDTECFASTAHCNRSVSHPIESGCN